MEVGGGSNDPNDDKRIRSQTMMTVTNSPDHSKGHPVAEPAEDLSNDDKKTRGRTGAIPFARPSRSASIDLVPQKREVKPNIKETPEEEYNRLLEVAKRREFPELEKLDFLSLLGKDTAGRPAVMLVSAHLPVKSIDLDDLLLFVIKKMDHIVNNEYAAVIVQSGSSSANRPTFAWMI
eukprot:TRINITY_DN7122_c0_g1_i2.p1 TRINITY_DN7122_c0_g1~~TRINITY_DN7122_c0_g1_i2.p1  ORF type:complete len:178 (-),score=42.94 TRINITY_DN7122_c0_g1_i2:972-1505(-)